MHDKAVALFERASDLEYAGNDFEAFKHFEQAMKLFAAMGDLRGEAISRRRIANILRRGGEFAEAMALNRAALPLFERLGDVREAAYAKGEIARLLAATLRGEEAVPLFHAALEAEPTFGDPEWRIEMLAALGNHLVNLSRRGEAVPIQQERLTLARQARDDLETHRAEIDLADAARDPADRAGWIAELQSHLPFFESADPRSAAGIISRLIGFHLECGQADEAEQLHQRREQLLDQRRPLDRVSAQYNLASIRTAQGREVEAIAILEPLLSELRRLDAAGPREVVLREYARLRAAQSRFRWLTETWILVTDGVRGGYRSASRSRER